MHRLLDFLFAYATEFGEDDAARVAMEKKHEISEKIMRILANGNCSRRQCRLCGKTLSWNHPYGICDHCYNSDYFGAFEDRYDFG